MGVLALGALTGCSTAPAELTAESFTPTSYVESLATEQAGDLSRFNMPAVDIANGSLQTAFNQAVANSQFLAEQVGIIERTDFRDGEFMTYIFDPAEENTQAGFWYEKSDGTSSFGRIYSPFVLGDDDFELGVKELDRVNEFVAREFSVKDDALVVDFGGYFLFEYSIIDDVIVEIVSVDNENPDASVVTYFEYGNQEKLRPLSLKLNAELGD